MAPVGNTKDVGWEIGVSRTVRRDVDDVWAQLTSPEGVAAWLGAGVVAFPANPPPTRP